MTERMTVAMILSLKASFDKLKTIDPCSENCNKIRVLLKTLSIDDLKAIIAARVKFLDTMATTELHMRGEISDEQRIEYTAKKLAAIV